MCLRRSSDVGGRDTEILTCTLPARRAGAESFQMNGCGPLSRRCRAAAAATAAAAVEVYAPAETEMFVHLSGRNFACHRRHWLPKLPRVYSCRMLVRADHDDSAAAASDADTGNQSLIGRTRSRRRRFPSRLGF